MSVTPPPPDPYAALGVSKDATLDQIRSSHRKLVLRAHPDRFPTASPEEKQKKADEFHKIQQAYEILSDNTERKKYDDNVRLAEAKANLMRERAEWAREKEVAGTRRAGKGSQHQSDHLHDYNPPPRSFTVPVHEARNNAIYEERVPRAAPKRYDDDFHQQYDPTSRFDDVRSSPKFKSESFKSGSRRTSARDIFAEDARRTEEYEEKMRNKARKQEQKSNEKMMHRADEKARDKNRRKERESAQYERTPKLGVLSDETDSEDPAPRYSRRKTEAPPSGRRAEEPSRRSRRDREGKSSRRSRDDYSSDSEDNRSHTQYRERQNDREREAAEYIRRQRGSSDMEEAARSNRHSKRNGERISSVPPPPPMAPTVPKDKADTAKRSSAAKKVSRESRESPSRGSSRRERPIEIVEPPTPKTRRSAADSSKSRPAMKNSESAPPEVLEHVLRTQTLPAKASEKMREPIPVRRAKTGDLEYMQSRGRERERERERDRSPIGTPKSRRGNEYSSPVVEDAKDHSYGGPVDSGWTRYQIVDNENLSPRIVPIEPGSRSSRARGPDSRDPSPRSSSRRTPARSGSVRTGLGIGLPPRANTFQDKSSKDLERDRLPRSQTMRAGSIDGPIFGEIPPGSTARDAVPPRPPPNRSSTVAGPTASYAREDVAWSPAFGKEDIVYSDRPRHERTASGMSNGPSGSGGGGSGTRREPRVFRERSPREKDRDGELRDGKKERSSRNNGEPYLARGGSNLGRHMPQVRV